MSSGYSVRTATIKDAKSITALASEPLGKSIGNIRNKYNAEDAFKVYQTHRLVVELEEKVVCYAEFRNYPAISSLPSDTWLEWLHQKYCISFPISWLNTLFLTFCVYKRLQPESLLEAVREVFYRDNRLWYLVTIRAPVADSNSYYVETFDDLAEFAKIYYPRDFSIISNPVTQVIYVTYRYTVLPALSYRKAMTEDNDDIVEMHSHEYPELRVELGDFYIAEELMRTDQEAKNNSIIVMELAVGQHETLSAGFMWLNADVDIRFYVTNYEMEMFGNLINFLPHHPYTYEKLLVLSLDRKPDSLLFTQAAMAELHATTVIGGVQGQGSGMSVVSHGKMRVSSISGTIVTSNDKFYTKEILFLQFRYIVENLYMINYYYKQEERIVNLFYNVKVGSKRDAVQSASNVFELKYIAVHETFPLPRLYNCLNAMYSAFPDRDYCIMTLPKSANTLRSHVEALKYFMPVAQRPSEVSKLDDIYITHRSTIFGEISLHRLQREDVVLILDVIVEGRRSASSSNKSSGSLTPDSRAKENENLENEKRVIKEITNDVLDNENSKYDFFTIRCGDSNKSAKDNTPIGYVVLQKYLNRHLLDYHFMLPNTDQHLENERAEIISLRLHPLFHNRADEILRNLAAKTNYFDFFYIYARNKLYLTNDLKAMMMQLEPYHKKRLFYKPKHKELSPTSETMILPEYDYITDSLVVFRHKLTPTRWFGKSNRLVIIGFTAVAQAFLRQLVFQWNCKDHFNSETYNCLPRLLVTVIAGPGVMEAEYDFMFECRYCKQWEFCYIYHRSHCCYVRDVIQRMDLRLWIHFVAGQVNFIDRKQKFVKLNESCEVPYDTLLILNYTSFCLQTGDSDEDLPTNFVEINQRLDKILLYYKLQVLVKETRRSYMTVVYGYNLQTFECIGFLLSHGVPAERIILVMPKDKILSEWELKMNNPFFDQNLQYVLEDMMADLTVKCHKGFNFSHWVKATTANFITEVVFTNPRTDDTLLLDCDLFISFDVGYMDPTTEFWLNESGICLRDKKILVNRNFRTNDPDIYAAGNFIEMIEAVNYQYKYVNEMETSMKLMEILELRTFDTPFEHRYARPTFFKAQMPLKYSVTKVTMPRRYLNSHLVFVDKCSMSTYHNQTFCRIGFNQKMVVDEIVVVTKSYTALDLLEHFCGKHESLLNNIKARYQAGAIKCFLEFLKEPWSELIMHPDFDEFQAKNHKILLPMVQNLHLTNAERNLIDFNQHFLEQNLLDFLRTHRNEFHYEFALPEDFVGTNPAPARN